MPQPTPIMARFRLSQKVMIECLVDSGFIVAAWLFDDLDRFGGGLSCAEWRAA